MAFRWRSFAALLFLLVLVAGFYWQLTLSGRYTWLENPDQALQVRPWLDYESRELHAGRIPLWAPYEWGGQSLIGQVQPGLANPLNWPLFAMPLVEGHIPISTLHWYWVLIHWLAAAFTYWLCRDLGCGRLASILGGAVYALAGFIGHSDTPQFLMGAVWIPVILLFLTRVGCGRRVLASAAWCGAAMGAAFLGGHHNIPTYTAVVVGCGWLYLLVRGPAYRLLTRAAPKLGPQPRDAVLHRNRVLTRTAPIGAATVRERLPILGGDTTLAHPDERRMWLAAAVFGSTALLIAAVQILPAIEYGRQSLRWVGAPDALRWNDRIPYSIHAEYSLGPRALPGLVLPGLAHHAEPFVGIVAVVLALIALRLGWRRWEVRMLGAVALGGLLLALGSATPVEHLAYLLVPMEEKARYPAMAIVICQAALAALAALGIEMCCPPYHLLRLAAPKPGLRPPGFVPSLADARGSDRDQSRDRNGADFAVAGLAPGAATVSERLSMLGWDAALAWCPAGFAAAVCAYYGLCRLLGRPTYAEPLWPAVAASVGLAVLLALRWKRAAPVMALALFLVEALALPAPVQPRDGPGSYAHTIESQRDIADFLRRQPGWFRVDLDEDVVPYNFGDWYGIEQFGAYTASMPVAVHAVLGHQETARLFGVAFRVALKPSNPYQFEVFQSRSGLRVYRDPHIGPPLWIEHRAEDTPCAADQYHLMSRTPQFTSIDATAGCPGLLVVGDPWFTGWRAWVDGRRVRIHQYQGIIRAVPLAAGAHRVEFRYQPGSVWWGAALSLLGLAFALLVHRTAQ